MLYLLNTQYLPINKKIHGPNYQMLPKENAEIQLNQPVKMKLKSKLEEKKTSYKFEY
jgi:hypothetical protein